MKNEEIMKEMREAVDRLNDASRSYYGGQTEKMTDYEWDALFDRLKKWRKKPELFSKILRQSMFLLNRIPEKRKYMNFRLFLLPRQKKPQNLSGGQMAEIYGFPGNWMD